MPRIPQLDNQVQEQGSPNATLTTQAPSGSFSGVARGLRSVSEVVRRQAEEARADANAVAVTEAEAELNRWETNRLYDADEGVLNTVRGKDALALPDTVMSDFQSRASEIRANLANAEQRRAFDQIMARHGTNINRRVQSYAAEQFEQYDAAQTDAALANSIEIVANNTDNPDRIREEFSRQERLIRSRGARTGAPEEVVEQKINAMASDSHLAVLNSMLSNQEYDRAKQYFDANAMDIQPDARANAREAVREAGTRRRSQRKADEIFARHESREDALKAAREINDAEVRDSTVQRINRRFQEREQIEAEEQSRIIDNAVQTITNGGSVDDIPPQEWSQIPRERRANLRALAARGEWYQDDERWYNFVQKSPEEMADMNLYEEVRPYVDDQHWNQALSMQQEAREAQRSNDPSAALSSTLTFKDRLDNALVRTDLFDKTTGLEGDDAARYAQIQTEAARQVQLREQDLGRKLTGNEVQEVIDGVMVERVFRDDFWSDPEIPVSGVLEDERGNVYVPMDQIPDPARQQIENLARSFGARVSNDKIRRAYAAALMNDNERVEAILRE